MKNLLLVGLGNPERQYVSTRHNMGSNMISLLSKFLSVNLVNREKLKGIYARQIIGDTNIHLLIPSVFMNNSGQTVLAAKNYLNLEISNVLVMHDELDILPGISKYKLGGGHGGHNGLKDIIQRLGDNSFHRLRIGIGHPGKGKDISEYVLNSPSKDDKLKIQSSFNNIVNLLPLISENKWQEVMLNLHTEEQQ